MADDKDKKIEEAKAEEAPKKEEAKAPEAEAPKAEAPKAEAKKPSAKAEAPKAQTNGAPKKPSAPKGEQGSASFGGGPGGKGRGGGRGRGARGSRGGQDKEAGSEFTEKVVQIRRVTKVCKGGKKLSFRAVVVIGNEKGKVGVGVGKASEVVNAIKKAVSEARKSMIDVKMVKSTVPHTMMGRAGSARVMLKPAANGTGIIAGGAARIVLELAGIGDILSKSQGSDSPLNVARATLNGLTSMRKFEEVARIRGLGMKQMLQAS